MQHLDHDMDDLFRKAGEEYPLKTGDDDWDKLAAKLQFEPAAPIVSKNKYSKYFIFLLLVLLLCLILGGLFYYDKPDMENTFKTKHIEAGINSDNPSIVREQYETHEAPSLPNDKKIMLKDLIKSEEINPSVHKKILNNSEPAMREGTGKKAHSNLFQSRKQLKKTANSQTKNYSYNQTPAPEIVGDETSNSAHDLKSTLVKSIPLRFNTSIVEPALDLAPIKISSGRSHNQRGLYLGMIGGPEFSKIGSQTSTRTGYHAGILVGYRLNTKLSLESGLMLGRNNYYSAGSYFNMNKISSSMPAGMEILTLEGQNTHVEIPVVLKYDVFHRPHSELFFTGGLISDLYLQEKNHYQTMLNGVKDNQMGIYDQNHFYLASQIHFSIGFEHAVGRHSVIRFEPYENIPIRKSGMGSMSVFSSGFNVGLLRTIGH